MKGEFINGKNYYLKLSISELKKYKYSFSFVAPGTLKYRLDGGSWVSVTAVSLFLQHVDENISTPVYFYQPISIDISSNTTIELYGKFDSLTADNVPIPVDTNVYRYFQSSAISEPIEMELYQCQLKRNVVYKTPSLTAMGYLYGVMRAECDFLNPIIEFESSEFPLFNYLIIPSFKRSYFVTNIINIRTNVYRMDLHVDVLNTYGEDIELQECFVSRCSGSYNPLLVDTRLPLKDVPTITFSVPTHGALKNTTLISNPVDNAQFRHITINVVSDIKPTRPVTENDSEPPSGTNLPSVDYTMFDNPNSNVYALLYSDYEKICNYFVNNDADLTYVCGCVSFPFEFVVNLDETSIDLVPIGGIVADSIPFYVGDHQPTITGLSYLPYVRGESTGYHVIGDFKIDSEFSGEKKFLNYEPYSQIELFIPYHGWVKLNPIDVLDQRIIVYFIADTTTGDGQVFIYNYATQKIIYSANVQIGVKLSLSSTNKEELTRQKQANTNNLILGLVSSGISIVGGVASENPMGIIKGLSSGAKSVVDMVNKNAMMFERANVSVNGDKIGLFTGNEIIVKKTQREPVVLGDDSVFDMNEGHPINDYLQISDRWELGDNEYLEIPHMRYKPKYLGYITSTEMDEIERLASDGIII